MTMQINFELNDRHMAVVAEERLLLSDLLRRVGATSVHTPCEHGACGACTVIVEGVGVLSCLMFGIQVDGGYVQTVESLGTRADHPMQSEMSRAGGLQCGFCTPGMVMAALDLLAIKGQFEREDVEAELSGNLCRCTGYVSIVDAVLAASARIQHSTTDES